MEAIFTDKETGLPMDLTEEGIGCWELPEATQEDFVKAALVPQGFIFGRAVHGEGYTGGGVWVVGSSPGGGVVLAPFV